MNQFSCNCGAENVVFENRKIVYCWNCGRGWAYRKDVDDIVNVSDAIVIGFKNITADDETFNSKPTGGKTNAK